MWNNQSFIKHACCLVQAMASKEMHKSVTQKAQRLGNRSQAKHPASGHHTDSSSVYVGFLPASICSEAHLRKLFLSFGAIESTAYKAVRTNGFHV